MAPGSPLKRLLPALKIAVAITFIALIAWVTPFRDQLVLSTGDGEALALRGRVLESTPDSATFVAEDGGSYRLALESDAVTAAVLPSGERLEDLRPLDAPGRSQLVFGLLTTLRTADPTLLLLALLLVFLGSLVAVYRWNLLLIGVDLGIGFRRAFSLTFIGAFFNNIMPGLTGGDLVKALYIAREHRDRKTEAIITVLLDRVLGITGLAVVAAMVIPLDLERYGSIGPVIFGLVAGVVVTGCVFFSRRLRAKLRIDALLARLPFQRVVRSIDRAVFLYRFRKNLLLVSFLLSMVVHVLIIAGIAAIGAALDLRLPVLTYFAVVPICLIVSALPVAPAGIGVGEAAAIYFLGTVGVAKAGALSLFFLYRVVQLVISLIGGPCLAMQRDRASAAEVEAFAANEQDNGGAEPAPAAESPPAPAPRGSAARDAAT